jgi:hypothetical protein
MNFESENSLVAAFLAQPLSFFNKVTGKRPKRYFLLREFDSGYGVADIVLGSFTPYFSNRSTRSSIDSNWAGTLVDALERGPFSLVDFARHNSVTEETARNKINQFVAAGFFRPEQNRFVKCKDYKIAIETSIAIEAKIKNWRHALNQARRYKRFSNYSYVLLDEKYLAPAKKNIQNFRQHNIGLITLNHSTLSVHFSPGRRFVPANIYFYKLNEVVHDYFRENYECS